MYLESVALAPSRPSQLPASARTSASTNSTTLISSRYATSLKRTTGPKATCVARSPETFAARWRSAATRAVATARTCPFVASAPRPMRAPARAPSAPSPERRSDLDASEDSWHQEGAPQGEEERCSGRSPHQEHVQQHARHHHRSLWRCYCPVSYTHLRAHETDSYLVC